MKKNNHTSFNWILVVTIIVVILYVIWIWYIINSNCEIKNLAISNVIFNAILNNPGDFIWGTLGIILTFGSLLMMVLTFRKQNDQFNEQFNMGFASRFEDTFYNLMSNFYEVRQMTNTDIKNGKGDIDSIQQFALKYVDELKSDPKLAEYSKALNMPDPKDLDIENITKEYGKKFKEFCSRYDFPLSYYFRFLYNMINFVISYWKNDRKEQNLYLNFIQSQLSDAELCLIFYNCLSATSKDSKNKYSFYDIIDQYEFLQNINPKWLVDISHHYFYKNTEFRFLNRDQKEIKNQAKAEKS